MMKPNLLDVLKALADENSYLIFVTIASNNSNAYYGINEGIKTEEALSKTLLPRRQYYRNLGRLLVAQLVKRRNGKYSITRLGRKVIEADRLVRVAIENYWRLKAVDSLGLAVAVDEFPESKYAEIMHRILAGERTQRTETKNR